MKRIGLLLLVTSCLVANAQWYPGVTGGIQITSLTNRHGTSRWEAGKGFRMGAFIDRPFLKHKIGVRIEGSYSLITQTDYSMNDELRLNYLSLPLSFFYMPNNQVQLFVGPQLNFLIRQNGPQYVTSYGKETFDRLDYGIHAALEIGFAYNFSIAFHYYQGLNYNSKNAADNSSDTINRISAIQLCLNYFFRHRKLSKDREEF